MIPCLCTPNRIETALGCRDTLEFHVPVSAWRAKESIMQARHFSTLTVQIKIYFETLK